LLSKKKSTFFKCVQALMCLAAGKGINGSRRSIIGSSLFSYVCESRGVFQTWH